MTDKQKLKELTETVSYMLDSITDRCGGDLYPLVEEAGSILELDVTFNKVEIGYLKDLKYKISVDNKLATKTYRGTPVYVKKEYFGEYTLGFGEDSMEYNGQLEDFVGDLADLHSTSKFFKKLLADYKKGLEEL